MYCTSVVHFGYIYKGGITMDFWNDEIHWGTFGDSESEEYDISSVGKVEKVEPCELDNLLYDIKYWEKAFETLTKRKLSINVYNELYEFRGIWKEFVDSIFNGEFIWGVPRRVMIPKDNGKKREVFMFETKQRLLLGVLNRILSDIFADKLSPVCYSYKTGVATITAVRGVRDKVYENGVNQYDCAIKLDISKYFNSISEERINEMLNTLFIPENRGVIYNLLKVLFSINMCRDKDFGIVEEYLSLIPGVAVSSFFANYCLADMDEIFRGRNDVVYARYCDDIILFTKDMTTQQECINFIENTLQGYGLSINEDKYVQYNAKDENIEFLGLKFNGDIIDISDKSFKKLKRKIRLLCRQARRNIERKKVPPYEEIMKVISKMNYIWYKCYVYDKSKFGWGYYAFRYITTDETLRKIDYYFRDMLRYVYTGKHNKGNWHKLPNEKLTDLGYVSLTFMYGTFKSNFEVYLDYVDRLR